MDRSPEDKLFVIVHHLVADSGHTVSVVKAMDGATAMKKYAKSLHMDVTPVGVTITEITEDVQEVYRYDNPLYEG